MGGGTIIQESDNQLRRYLLGELDERGEEQVEFRLLTDAEYARQLDLAVDEIIDQYVLGKFTGAELDRVRNYFLKSSERQAKLRFVLALKERKSRRSARNESTPRRFPPYLAIAASVLAILGIGFFGWRALQPKPDLNEGLIALQSAFREERPIEGRLSDFNYAPLPNQRGGTARVDHVQRDLAAALLLKEVRDRPTAAAHQAAGKYYLMNHQFEQAKKELASALELDPKNAKIHNDLGTVFLEEARLQSTAADNSKQLELYGRSLEQIQRALELDSSLLEALFNRALVLQFMRPSEQAKEAWNKYLQSDSSSRWAEEARRNLKTIEQEQRKSSVERNESHKLFLAAMRESNDDAAWKVVRASYTSAGNEVANSLIDSLLAVEPFSEPVTWDTLRYLAKLETERSGDRFTLDLVNHYSRAGPKLAGILANARHHMRTAYSSFQRSNFREAIDEYSRAKLNYERAQDDVGQIFAEYRLAHCYVLLPDAQRARAAFSRLLGLCERNHYRWLTAQCLYGLAHASSDESEYSQAIDYSAQALVKFEETGDWNGVLKCLTQLADFNHAINRINTALHYLSRTLSLADESGLDPKQKWGILNQIGFSMTSLQLHAAALFYQQEALQLAMEMDIPLLISRSYSYVGSAYAAMERYQEAVDTATKAFETGRRMTGERRQEITAHTWKQLGDIHRASGRCDLAVKNYDQSLQMYRNLRVDFYSYVAHKGKLQCFIATLNHQEVRTTLRSVLSLSEWYRSKITDENQRSSFFDAEQEVYDLAIGYEFGVQKNYEKALEYSEQSRARSLLDAVEQSAQIRKRRRAARLKSSVVTTSLSVDEIQARIPATSQLLQYVVLDDKVIIWLITRTQVKEHETSIDALHLTEMVNTFLETINHPPTDANYSRHSAAALFNVLIKPVEKHLDKSKTLVIIPDKILNYLPFSALVSQENSTYLIEDYQVSVAASATLFVNLSEAANRVHKRGSEHILIVGDPLFNPETFKSLRQLPASLEEAGNVAELYSDHKLLVREHATETTIRREMEKGEVVHFAMHFVLNEQSEMLSGFPLTPDGSANVPDMSDGFLQSYEIARLNLGRTLLAVLSACQTGIEKQYRGEGAVGAARPFFVAGVPTVVGSLWPVDSDASAELMTSFHRHRLGSLATVQALRQAQLELIRSQDQRYRHPYYWAPFLVIGGVAHN